MPNPKDRQRLERSYWFRFPLVLSLSFYFFFDPVLFFLSQKLCLARPARQHKIGHDPKYNRRSRLQNQQPPPARQMHPVNVVQNPSRQWRSNDVACRQPSQKHGDTLRLPPLFEPVRQIKCNPRKISALSHSQQETQNI